MLRIAVTFIAVAMASAKDAYTVCTSPGANVNTIHKPGQVFVYTERCSVLDMSYHYKFKGASKIYIFKSKSDCEQNLRGDIRELKRDVCVEINPADMTSLRVAWESGGCYSNLCQLIDPCVGSSNCGLFRPDPNTTCAYNPRTQTCMNICRTLSGGDCTRNSTHRCSTSDKCYYDDPGSSSAVVFIVILLIIILLIGAAVAVYFFVLRPRGIGLPFLPIPHKGSDHPPREDPESSYTDPGPRAIEGDFDATL